MTEFEKDIYLRILNKCVLRQWYILDPKRNDYEKILSALKAIIEKYGIVEFKDDTFSEYRRVESGKEIMDILEGQEDSRRGRIEDLESIILPKTYKHTTSKLKSLKTEEKDFPNKGIPGVCSRPDICDRIMKESRDVDYEKLEKEKQEQERLQKIKKWKNQN